MRERPPRRPNRAALRAVAPPIVTDTSTGDAAGSQPRQAAEVAAPVGGPYVRYWGAGSTGRGRAAAPAGDREGGE